MYRIVNCILTAAFFLFILSCSTVKIQSSLSFVNIDALREIPGITIHGSRVSRINLDAVEAVTFERRSLPYKEGKLITTEKWRLQRISKEYYEKTYKEFNTDIITLKKWNIPSYRFNHEVITLYFKPEANAESKRIKSIIDNKTF